ncbi:integrase arm-type DNA-binding domain-containing protein [Polaromonas sp. YR568]|uniref:tyrosine-type recombinase/integrase n=1 Tax=Polaromonas sp. YR568 TaxID=1855301 RepID=UPI003137A278
MRVRLQKLSDLKIESVLKGARQAAADDSGKVILLGDGGGLTLQISKTGSASWLHRYMRDGRPTAVGLGAYPQISLHEARKLAQEYRRLLIEGEDPLATKRSLEAVSRLRKLKGTTFNACAAKYIADHRAEWKSSKHAQQWENTLTAYAFPVIGMREISAITTQDLVRILQPIWLAKKETASRVRGRVEAVIDWATALGYRTGENPARYKGHLEHLLARSTPEQRADKHHAALPHSKIPGFMKSLSAQDGMARWALEFLILTACRTSEVLNAKWSEISEEECLWVIPKERMKAAKTHRVPLVERALEILMTVKTFQKGDYIFPSGAEDSPLSNMALAMLLRRMGAENATVHGFRSTFRDWIGEKTNHDFRTAEAALAHKIPDRVAAAYARSDLYDKRFSMMEDWGAYCTSWKS